MSHNFWDNSTHACEVSVISENILCSDADASFRYVGQMGGVLLAHWDHELEDDTVGIIGDCPYGICQVVFKSIVWAPKLGQRLCTYSSSCLCTRIGRIPPTHQTNGTRAD